MKSNNKRQFFLIWALTIICMVPYYLAFFPGVYGYDTPIQMMMYFGEYSLSSHHPLAHTYLVGEFLSFGSLIFGNYIYGFILFIIFQWLLISNALAQGFYKLINLRLNKLILILLFMWTFIFCPAIMVLSFNSTKDTLFGAFFLYFFLTLWEIIEKKNEKVGTWLYLRLGVFSTLVCLFRNQGIYIIICFIIVLLIIRTKPGHLFIPLIASAAVYFCFSLFISGLLHIPKGDMKEMLSVPIMQMAYTVNEYRSGKEVSLSEEELKMVYELLPEKAFDNSDGTWDGADYFKAWFDTSRFKAEPKKYCTLYLKIGIKNIKEYFTEFHNLVSPYFFMGKCRYRGLMFDPAFEEQANIQIPILSKIPILRKATHFYITRLSNYFLILEPGIGIYILFAGVIVAICKKKKEVAILFTPHILYFLTCLLGPIALIRYLYPVMLVTPFAAGYLLSVMKQKK